MERSASCDAASICARGHCVALPREGSVTIGREKLYDLSNAGWLNAWAYSAGFGPRSAERILTDPALAFTAEAGPTRALRVGTSGYLEALPPLDQSHDGASFAVLTGHLVAPQSGEARLALGVAGHVRVWIGSALVAEITRASGSRRPLEDEVDLPITLIQGGQMIVALVERSGEAAAGFWARVTQANGQPMADVRFAPAELSSGARADLLDTETDVSPIEGGFAFDVRARFRGLVPRGLRELPFSVGVRVRDGAKEEALEQGSVGLSALTEGWSQRFTWKAPRPGSYDLSFALGEGDRVMKRTAPLLYQGPIHERVVALRHAVDAVLGSNAPEASRQSFAHHVSLLTATLARGVVDASWFDRLSKDAESMAAAFARGEDPYSNKRGLVRRVYLSKLDGRPQPYLLYVPGSYASHKAPVPLVVVAHGLNRAPEHALATAVGEAPDDKYTLDYALRHLPPVPDFRSIVVAPFAYESAGARPVGEEDVLRVIDEVSAVYDVDPRRVSMTGVSLGGTAAFVVPLHHPDRFSVAAPLCGYPNLATYANVRGVAHAAWEDALIAKRYIANYAENGVHLPLRIVHGGLDAPARSAVVAERYRALRYRYAFDIQDDLDHNVWDYAYEDAKFLQSLTWYRRPEAPKRIRFVTGDYRYDRAYGLRVLAMKSSLEATDGLSLPGFCDLDGAVDEAERTLTLSTKNVAAFAVDMDRKRVAKVVVDGVAIELPNRDEGPSFLVREVDSWTRSDAEPSRVGKKRHGVSGPLDDVQHHAVLVVQGTADPSQNEANRLAAEHFATGDVVGSVRYPIKRDVDVTDADLVGQSLVLVGNPRSNTIAAKLAPSLPVSFEPHAVVFRGTRYAGDDVGVSFIHPSPVDPNEYVVVHAGVSSRGTLASRHLPQLAPDFLVYDGRITVQRGELLLDKRQVLAGGFFDDDWR